MKTILFLFKNILIKIFLMIICGYVCLIFIKNALTKKSKNSKIIWTAWDLSDNYKALNELNSFAETVCKLFLTR